MNLDKSIYSEVNISKKPALELLQARGIHISPRKNAVSSAEVATGCCCGMCCAVSCEN